MSSGRSKETASTSFLEDLFCRTDVYYVFIMKWGWVKFADTTERSYLKFVLWAKGEQQQQKNVPTTAHTSKKSSYCIWYGIWFKMKEFFCQFSFSQKTWRFWCVQQNSPLTCVVVMVMEEFLEENVKKKKEQNFFFFCCLLNEYSTHSSLTLRWAYSWPVCRAEWFTIPTYRPSPSSCPDQTTAGLSQHLLRLQAGAFFATLSSAHSSMNSRPGRDSWIRNTKHGS